MLPINRKRVFIGGLAGGLVWLPWSSLVNALILGARYQELTGSGLLLEEQRYSFFVGAWALTLMVLSMILAWMYAAARAALGAGPGTALKLGLVLGFVAGFPSNLAQATFSALPRVIPLWWMLDLWVGAVLAALMAASLYRDKEEDDRRLPWRRLEQILLAVAVLLLAVTGAPAGDGGSGFLQGKDPWFVAGQETLAEAQKLTPLRRRAKNIILFIGDGMSTTTVTAARIFEGQRRGESGEENLLSFERMPFLALAKTYNTNLQVPDSAGTATALLSGVKTKAGVLGVASGVVERDCRSASGRHVTSIVELAERIGMSTGVVSTAAVTHATPAAAYAHTPSRGWQVDGSIPEQEREAGCVDIARQLVEFAQGDGLDVVLGGGRRDFLPEGTDDPEEEEQPGRRQDGRNLTREWSSRRDARYVWNLEQFQAVDPARTGPLLGLFQPNHLQYETDRLGDKAGEPSLSRMTRMALDVLERNPRGYFLLVEGGRIDHAHHGGNAYRALVDTVEFARAVQVALDRTDAKDTLVIVTADHSHVLTFAGYPVRGNPILGEVRDVDEHGAPKEELEPAKDGLPYTTLSYANGPGYRSAAERQAARDEDTAHPDYLQQAGLDLDWETHGGDDVPVYARGPGAQLIRGVMEQNYIFHVMDAAGRLRKRAAAAAE